MMRALMWLCIAAVASAAPPGLESLVPAGGQVASRVEVLLSGAGLDKGSPMAWTNHPGLVLLAGDKPKKFQASISKDVPPGPYLMRFYTNEGATPPRIFEVGTLAEVTETEPNDVVKEVKSAPQMNVTINGVLLKSGDVDTHAIRVQKGKRVILELHGYALGSPMDPAMRLMDVRGVEIAAGHDTHNLDPRIEHVPAVDGTYFVQVFAFAHPPAADVALMGSANHVYRLTVTDEEKKTPAVSEPKTLTAPVALHGRISKNGEEDRFGFLAKKGEDWQIEVHARNMDATLRIEDADGKVLQQADDGEKEDVNPTLRWKVAKDGEFKMVIADRFQHGGPDHDYELTVKPFAPKITATLAAHAYRVEIGKSVEMKLSVKTNGAVTGKMQARVVEVPAGVTAAVMEVPAKGGDVTLTLKVAADAVVSQAPFAVEVTSDATTVRATYAVPFTEPRGALLIMNDAQPWLTVAAGK